jgi:type VI secretion system protein ImpG
VSEQEELLRHYEQELTHLRKMGVEFARSYPKVAGRLELSHDGCADPYVERLIESFAYLTARIRYNLDSQFPEIPAALLNILYPHYTCPVPSISVARFEADPTQGKLTSGYVIPKHTSLLAQAHQGQTLRFRTCYPVTLMPVEVVEAGYETPEQFDYLDLQRNIASAIRLRIAPQKGSLAELGLKGLRFYLNGEPMLVHAIYQLLFGPNVRVAVLPEGANRPIILPEGSLRTVGFGADEEVLPYPKTAHPQYRLLQEYFAFPEKFLFLDLDNLDCHGSQKSFDIYFLFDRVLPSRLAVGRETFALGCTPVINLFRKTSEPIRLSHLRSEYPLVPDMRREAITEIYSIDRVSSSSDPSEASMIVEPFFSYNHESSARRAGAYWYARRVASERKDIPGSEVVLSLVDLSFRPSLPAVQTIFAHLLCTNRHAADQIPSGALLQMEEAAPVARVEMLRKPTPQVDSPLTGMAYWRLISHLSLNYLSLSDDEESLRALQEILLLYIHQEDSSHHHQIQGIREMSCRKVTRRIGRDAWRGFCRGTEITLTFDEERYVGSSAFLFASVLNHFFALYTSINSFTQLNARSAKKGGIWKQWPAMVGEQNIL